MNEIKLGKKTAYTTIITPKGVLTGFSAVFEPSVKFNKEGVYNASILVSKEDGEKILEIVKAVQKEQYKNFKSGKDKLAEISTVKPYALIDDEGNEIPDKEGRYIIKAKACARIKDGIAGFKPAVFDAKLKPVKALPLGEGSILKLKLDLSGYSVGGKIGVSVKLSAVQIIKFTAYSGSSTSEGFEEEEGFEIEAQETAEKETTEDVEINEDEIGF